MKSNQEYPQNCEYPQRKPVPKETQGEPTVRPNAAKQCCEKQYGTAGWN